MKKIFLSQVDKCVSYQNDDRFQNSQENEMQKRILQLNREHYRINNYDLHLIWNSYHVFDKCPRFK